MSNSTKSSKGLSVLAKLFLVIEAACLTLLCLFLSNILPIKYLGIGIAVFVLIIALQVILCISERGVKAKSIISIILSILLIAVAIVSVLFMRNVYDKLDDMVDVNTQSAEVEIVSTMNIYVRAEDGYTELKDLKGKTFGLLGMMDTDNTQLAVTQIESVLGETLNTQEVPGVLALMNQLRDKNVDAIIVNKGYQTTLEDNDGTFKEWAVLLTTVDVTKKVSSTDAAKDPTVPTNTSASTSVAAAPVEDITVQPFCVYLQGMDTRGDQIVAEVGNSDVNMVIAVNPQTKKILLVNIPRDYYYYLWGDSSYPDKITHAGYYGVDCSIQTMDSLFGIDINYYVKVGFNSVINIVNAVGGISVYSDYTFDLEGYQFYEGENWLDGGAALQFARERESLPGGDRARGMNQQKVITAILQKVTSPDMIGYFSDVLTAVTQNVVTNISVDDMNKVVKMQLNDGATWNIESIQVDGAGTDDYCYSLGDSNYVMVPDWDTVYYAQGRIYEVLNGQ